MGAYKHINVPMKIDNHFLNQLQRHCQNSCTILEGVNLNTLKIDSDWLPKYKCHVINKSEMLLERQSVGR